MLFTVVVIFVIFYSSYQIPTDIPEYSPNVETNHHRSIAPTAWNLPFPSKNHQGRQLHPTEPTKVSTSFNWTYQGFLSHNGNVSRSHATGVRFSFPQDGPRNVYIDLLNDGNRSVAETNTRLKPTPRMGIDANQGQMGINIYYLHHNYTEFPLKPSKADQAVGSQPISYTVNYEAKLNYEPTLHKVPLIIYPYGYTGNSTT